MDIKLTPDNIEKFSCAFKRENVYLVGSGTRPRHKQIGIAGEYQAFGKEVTHDFGLEGRIEMIGGGMSPYLIFDISLRDGTIVPFVIPTIKDDFKSLFYGELRIKIEDYDLEF